MKKIWIILISLLSVSFLVLGGLFLIGYFRPKPGGLLINTNPVANVYINGELAGKTPYDQTMDIGEVDVKLVAQGDSQNYLPFETKVNLISGVKTVIRKEFGDSDENSSGEVISFEKISGKTTELVTITTPDNSQVSIDGTVRGFSPYKTTTVTAGEHVITIKSVGYFDKTITINVVPGYRLSIIADLAKEPEKEEEKVAAAETEVKTMVEILDTPTGFLRVRTEPGSAGSEIHQVNPGEKYTFLEEDPDTGWYKIQIQDPAPGLPNGIVGWVSNEYSKKVEEDATPSDTTN